MFEVMSTSSPALICLFGAGVGLACTRAGPPIRAVDGPLNLVVQYPTQAPLALGESVAVWGSVGSGRATLTINQHRVVVEPNGAFLDWLPLPGHLAPVLDFRAQLKGRTVTRSVTLNRAMALRPGLTTPRAGRGWARLRRVGKDTLDAASQRYPITARWFPGGPFALLLPVGSRLPIEVRTDSAIGMQLSGGLRVWVAAQDADTLAGPPPNAGGHLGPMRVEQHDGSVELSVPLAEPLPSAVELYGTNLRWSIFGARHTSTAVVPLVATGFLRSVRRRDGPPGRADVDLKLAVRASGWRSKWASGRLTLQVRQPRAYRGVVGLVVALDAGHPPAGSTGPTGLREDSVTLQVARVAARQLERLGAKPVLVRAGSGPLSLAARLEIAEAADADVLISIHLNAPNEQQAPWIVDGTRTFYEEPLSRALARALHDSVSTAMRQRRRGVSEAPLVVLRSTWFPSVLIEGTCLVMPEREAWLRTPAGIEAYATGIVRGLAAWAAMRTPAERPDAPESYDSSRGRRPVAPHDLTDVDPGTPP
jgi:N-acetylmuramoyl-L-alanine amidase